MHPKVREFYNKTGIDYLESVQDRLESKFNKDSALSEKVVAVESMYRVKRGGLKAHEYLWYTEKHSSTDRKGNPISIIKIVGKYEMPVAQMNFDDEANPQPAGVSDLKTVYEIQWNPKLIDEFEEKGMITETTQSYVDNGSRKYGNFFMENFRNRDFEDLLYFGQSGRLPTAEEKEILAGPPSKRMGQNASATAATK